MNKAEPFQLRGTVESFHEWEGVTKLCEERFCLSQFASLPKSLQKAILALKSRVLHKEKVLPNESNRNSLTKLCVRKNYKLVYWQERVTTSDIIQLQGKRFFLRFFTQASVTMSGTLRGVHNFICIFTLTWLELRRFRSKVASKTFFTQQHSEPITLGTGGHC